MSTKPKTSGLAVAALVLSILCFPIGLILGIIALVQLGKTDDRSGKGLALAAVIIGGGMLPVTGILSAIAVPNFIRYKLRSQSMEARANLRAIATQQETKQADWGRYLKGAPSEGVVGTQKLEFQVDACSPDCSAENPGACTSLACLDFTPAGQVYYRYACEVTDDGQSYACAAYGDLDGDGEPGLYVIASGDGRLVAPVPDFDGTDFACPRTTGGDVADCARGSF